MEGGRTPEDLAREASVPEKRLQEWLDFLPDALIEAVLPDGPITRLNRMARSLFGWTSEDVAGGVDPALLFADGEYARVRGIVDDYVGKSVATRTPYTRSGRQDLYEVRMKRRDGSEFEAECQSSFVLDDEGVPVGIRSIVRDITERKEAARQLEELSYRDPLTGCHNRRHLERERERLEGAGARWAGLVFDMDHLKEINDRDGHEEGDRLLRGFAHFVRQQHRPDDLFVRTGGDEFVLIAEAAAEPEAEAMARRLREAAGRKCPAQFSMGVAFRGPGESLGEVLARADRSMYESRTARRVPARRSRARRARNRRGAKAGQGD